MSILCLIISCGSPEKVLIRSFIRQIFFEDLLHARYQGAGERAVNKIDSLWSHGNSILVAREQIKFT